MGIQNILSGLRGFGGNQNSERFSSLLRGSAPNGGAGAQGACGHKGGNQGDSPFAADGSPNRGGDVTPGTPSGPREPVFNFVTSSGNDKPPTGPTSGGSPFIADGNPNQGGGIPTAPVDQPVAGPAPGGSPFIADGNPNPFTDGGFGTIPANVPLLDGNLIGPDPGNVVTPGEAPGEIPVKSGHPSPGDSPFIADGNPNQGGGIPTVPVIGPAPGESPFIADGNPNPFTDGGFGTIPANVPLLDGNLIGPDPGNVVTPGEAPGEIPVKSGHPSPGDSPFIADGNPNPFTDGGFGTIPVDVPLLDGNLIGPDPGNVDIPVGGGGESPFIADGNPDRGLGGAVPDDQQVDPDSPSGHPLSNLLR